MTPLARKPSAKRLLRLHPGLLASLGSLLGRDGQVAQRATWDARLRGLALLGGVGALLAGLVLSFRAPDGMARHLWVSAAVVLLALSSAHRPALRSTSTPNPPHNR